MQGTSCKESNVEQELSAEDILQLLKGSFVERSRARQLLGFFDEQKMISHR